MTARFKRSVRLFLEHWDFVVIAIGVALIFRPFFHSLIPYVFQHRDVTRARLLAHGKWFFFGPETIEGSYLPGSFYYMLLAIPIRLGLGVHGCWDLLVLLIGLSSATLWKFFEKNFGQEEAYFAGALLVSQPVLLIFCLIFENFSYLPFFGIVSLIFVGQAFASETKAVASWYFACFVLALATELHGSALAWVIGGVILQMAAPYLRLKRVPWRHFCGGILLMFIIFAPYFAWRAHEGLVTVPGPSFNLDWRHLRAHVVRFPLLVSPLFVSMLAWVVSFEFYHRLRKLELRRETDSYAARLVRTWTVLLLVGAPAAIYLMWHPHRYRYVITFALAFPFVVAGWIHLELVKNRRRFIASAVTISTLLAAVTIFIISKEKNGAQWSLIALAVTLPVYLLPQTKLRPQGRKLILVAALLEFTALQLSCFSVPLRSCLNARDFQFAAKTIISQTGWTWRQAREKLFLVNVQYQIDPGLIYRYVFRNRSHSTPSQHSLEKPDGFFILNTLRKPKAYEPNSFKERLMASHLPTRIQHGIKSGSIALGAVVHKSRIMVAPYFVHDKEHYPAHFQNLGTGYVDLFQGPSHMADSRETYQTLAQSHHYQFHFNECPNHEKICDIQFDISSVNTAEGGRSHLLIRLTGGVISKTSPWIHYGWTQNLSQPFVKFWCDLKGPPKILHVASSIGFSRRLFRSSVRYMNHTILAPIERFVTNPCGNYLPVRLAAGYLQSVANTSGKKTLIPAQILISPDYPFAIRR